MIWLMLSLAHAAPCEAPSNAHQLTGALAEAEVAFASMDEEAFRAATVASDQLLICLSETLTPPDAAAWHRVEGLSAFLAGDADLTGQHFAASRALQPGYRLPSRIAPEGHPLRTAWQSAPSASEHLRVGSGQAAWLVVDGRRSDAVPLHRPSVVQWVAADGSVSQSRVVSGATELPAPLAQPPVVAEPAVPELPPVPQRRQRPMVLKVGLGTVAAASLVGSAISLGVANHHSNQFWDATTSPTQLEQHRSQANRYSWAGVGLGALAVAGGTTLVFTW